MRLWRHFLSQRANKVASQPDVQVFLARALKQCVSILMHLLFAIPNSLLKCNEKNLHIGLASIYKLRNERDLWSKRNASAKCSSPGPHRSERPILSSI